MDKKRGIVFLLIFLSFGCALKQETPFSEDPIVAPQVEKASQKSVEKTQTKRQVAQLPPPKTSVREETPRVDFQATTKLLSVVPAQQEEQVFSQLLRRDPDRSDKEEQKEKSTDFIQAWMNNKIIFRSPSLSQDGRKMVLSFCIHPRRCALLVIDDLQAQFLFPEQRASWDHSSFSKTGDKIFFRYLLKESEKDRWQLGLFDFGRKKTDIILEAREDVFLGAFDVIERDNSVFFSRAVIYPEITGASLFSLLRKGTGGGVEFLLPSDRQATAFGYIDSVSILSDQRLLLGLSAPVTTELNGKDWEAALSQAFPSKPALYKKILPYVFNLRTASLELHPIALRHGEALVLWTASEDAIAVAIADGDGYDIRLFVPEDDQGRVLITLKTQPLGMALEQKSVIVITEGEIQKNDLYRYDFRTRELKKINFSEILAPFL